MLEGAFVRLPASSFQVCFQKRHWLSQSSIASEVYSWTKEKKEFQIQKRHRHMSVWMRAALSYQKLFSLGLCLSFSAHSTGNSHPCLPSTHPACAGENDAPLQPHCHLAIPEGAPGPVLFHPMSPAGTHALVVLVLFGFGCFCYLLRLHIASLFIKEFFCIHLFVRGHAMAQLGRVSFLPHGSPRVSSTWN